MSEQERHLLFKIKPALAGNQVADSSDIEVDGTNHTGAFANSNNMQVVVDRLDATGLGSNPTIITSGYISDNANIATWYGGKQTDTIQTARSLANGNHVIELPEPDELTTMFDDLASRGLGEVYTRTFAHLGGSSTFVGRNSLTIRPPSVSNLFDRNELPTTLAQGSSATFRITRISGVIDQWERIAVESASDAVAAFGTLQFQTRQWNNSDNAFLPDSANVQKGYAFPVGSSNPDDGTLRQGLLDSGVSDRFIYDGDWVVWTADAFTSWTDGDNWVVFSDGEVNRFTREAQRFLTQVSEVDNRVDVGSVASMANNALVWVSENPLADAPFLTPSGDTNNPRSGDDYAYIGGQENRNSMQQFQFGQNRFNSYLTVGITPSFITTYDVSDIRVRIVDTDRNILDDFNLGTDFVFRDEGNFTNSTVRHYTRSTSVNYPFLATIEIVLTEIQRHFSLNPQSVDITSNIPFRSIIEDKLSSDVVTKLNANLTPDNSRFEEIEPRLCPYTTVSSSNPETDVLFLDSTGSDAYPSDVSSFNAVSTDNPRFTGGDIALYLAVPSGASHALLNVTTDSIVALDDSEATVSVIESIRDSATQRTYFVYIVTGLTSGHIYEVEKVSTHQVLAWVNDIDNLQDDVSTIEAKLEHAVFDLPDDVVQVLENEVSVTEEDNPVVVATDYNRGLGNTNAQTVFYESNPNTPSSGIASSKPISDSVGDRARRKLIYIPEGTTYTNQAYVTAFDGTTGRDLIRYSEGTFNAEVFVPAKAAGSSTETIYPAQATRFAGAGVWQTLEALTFVNGFPTTEANEIFFTRNVPTQSTTLDIQYRGHANGNLFGQNSTTLVGVGGSSDVRTSVTISDGGESVTIEFFYRAAQRDIRVSVTEYLPSGLPIINDIQTILSYNETRVVPAVAATTRDVAIESLHSGAQVFAIKPSSTNTLILVGDSTEIDTGYTYTTLFGASENGYLIVPSEAATFLDYQDFDVIDSTVSDLENHATLPQFGLFTTEYTHDTITRLDTQLQVLNSVGDVVNVGSELVLVRPDGVRKRLSIDNDDELVFTTVT